MRKPLLGRVGRLFLACACIALTAVPAAADVAYRSAATATAQTMPSSIIQFRGTGALAQRGNGNVAPAYPAGTLVNDLLLCVIETKDNVAVSMPAGWTALLAGSSGGSHQALVFWKRAANGDLTPTVTHPAGNSIIARIVGFANVATSGSPFEGTASLTNSASDLSTEAAAITTVSAGAVLVFTAHIADNNSSIDNANTPPGWVETFASSTSLGTDSSIEVWYTMPMSVGAQAALTMPRTVTAALSSGGMIALKPANAAFPALTINKPAATAANDTLLAGLSFSPDKTAVNPPAGWTLLRRTEQASGNRSVLLTYWKTAGSGEPSTYTWNYWGALPDTTGISNDGAVGSILAFSGASTVAPVATDAGQATASSLSHSAPSVTTTQANDMLVSFHELASSATWTPPGAMTEAVDIASRAANNSAGISLEANYQTIGSAGASGTKAANASANKDTGATAAVVLSQLSCFSESFSGSNGAAPGGNWSVGNKSQGGSGFGSPQIASNRLRLTDNSTAQATWATLNRLFPAHGNKIVVSFDHFSYNGSGGDGVGVILSDAAKAPAAGAFGGSLGYAEVDRLRLHDRGRLPGFQRRLARRRARRVRQLFEQLRGPQRRQRSRTAPGFGGDSRRRFGPDRLCLHSGHRNVVGGNRQPGVEQRGAELPLPHYHRPQQQQQCVHLGRTRYRQRLHGADRELRREGRRLRPAHGSRLLVSDLHRVDRQQRRHPRNRQPDGLLGFADDAESSPLAAGA
jgi:MSHA biogenesis protein MshQ